MRDTDREARLEEIREHMNDPQGYVAEKDWRRYARFLLTEADRLREVLREAVVHHEDQYEAWKGAEPEYQTGEEALVSDYHRERADRLKAKLEGEDD